MKPLPIRFILCETSHPGNIGAVARALKNMALDDLVLVKGGPGERRGWLDDAAVGLDTRTEGIRSDVERILKQRNALLKQSRGRLDDAAALTLDVWDDRLTRAGEALAERRAAALAEYDVVSAHRPTRVGVNRATYGPAPSTSSTS